MSSLEEIYLLGSPLRPPLDEIAKKGITSVRNFLRKEALNPNQIEETVEVSKGLQEHQIKHLNTIFAKEVIKEVKKTGEIDQLRQGGEN
jgi:hypothetical protein